MSAPAVQDASWLSYSCRTVTLRDGGGMRMGCGNSMGVGGVVGCLGYVELGDDGQGVGEGECGDKEVRDGEEEMGEGIRFGTQWTPAGTQ